MSVKKVQKPSPFREEKCYTFLTRSKDEFIRAYCEGEYIFLTNVVKEIEKQKERKLSMRATADILGCDKLTAKYYMETLKNMMLSER